MMPFSPFAFPWSLLDLFLVFLMAARRIASCKVKQVKNTRELLVLFRVMLEPGGATL